MTKTLLIGILLLSGAGALSAQGGAATPAGTSRAVHAPEPTRLARTWIVDAQGGGDFTNLQTAIDTASSGDVLLLRSDILHGVPLRIDGKGLFLVGEGTRRRIEGLRTFATLIVENVPAGASVVLRELEIKHRFNANMGIGNLVLLRQSEGTIWIEQTAIEMLELVPAPETRAIGGLRAEGCASVTLHGVTIAPEPFNFSSGTFPVPVAFEAIDTAVHAHDVFLLGHAQCQSFCTGGPGGDACRLTRSSLVLSASEVHGGNGGRCGPGVPPQVAAAPGGIGLRAFDASSARLIDVELHGGSGGTCFGGPPGVPGPDSFLDGTSTLETLAGNGRLYSVDRLVTAGEPAGVVATGLEGDLVLALVSLRTQAVWLPLHLGELLVAPPFEIVVEGTIPASGVLETETRIPPLHGVHTVFRQGLFLATDGEVFLGSASATVVVGR